MCQSWRAAVSFSLGNNKTVFKFLSLDKLKLPTEIISRCHSSGTKSPQGCSGAQQEAPNSCCTEGVRFAWLFINTSNTQAASLPGVVCWVPKHPGFPSGEEELSFSSEHLYGSHHLLVALRLCPQHCLLLWAGGQLPGQGGTPGP